MQQKRREDRMPQGWVRRSTTATSTTTAVTTGATVSTLSSSTTTTATARTKTVPVTDGADSDSPAEEDIKIQFEDVSSDSSDSREFDLLKHKTAKA